MERNPYAPPQASVGDLPPASHGLKRRRVLVMILFIFISFGTFYLIWWFRRRPGLNRLNSPRKLALWPLLMMVTLYVIQFVIGFAAETNPGVEVISPGGAQLVTLFQFVVGIVMIFQAFKVKNMIEDHAAPEVESGPALGQQVTLSGLMTFFFSILYLQWAINRYVIAQTD